MSINTKKKFKVFLVGFPASIIAITALFLFFEYRNQSTFLNNTGIAPINLINEWEFESIHLSGSLTRVSFLNTARVDKKTGATPGIGGFWDDVTPSEKNNFSQINTSIINAKIREMRMEGIWSIEKSGVFFVVVKSGFLSEATYIYSPNSKRFDPTLAKNQSFDVKRLKKISDNWYVEE